MKKLVVFLLCLVLLTAHTDANPVIREKFAKQLLRSKRQDRPLKAGHPDEPMRVRPPRGNNTTCFTHSVAIYGSQVSSYQSEKTKRCAKRKMVKEVKRKTPNHAVRELQQWEAYWGNRAILDEHLLRMQALDQRAQGDQPGVLAEPHCPPRCDRNYGHPV